MNDPDPPVAVDWHDALGEFDPPERIDHAERRLALPVECYEADDEQWRRFVLRRVERLTVASGRR